MENKLSWRDWWHKATCLYAEEEFRGDGPYSLLDMDRGRIWYDNGKTPMEYVIYNRKEDYHVGNKPITCEPLDFFSRERMPLPDNEMKEELQKAIDNMHKIPLEKQSEHYSLLSNAYDKGLISKEILAFALQTGELKVSEYVKIITNGK